MVPVFLNPAPAACSCMELLHFFFRPYLLWGWFLTFGYQGSYSVMVGGLVTKLGVHFPNSQRWGALFSEPAISGSAHGALFLREATKQLFSCWGLYSLIFHLAGIVLPLVSITPVVQSRTCSLPLSLGATCRRLSCWFPANVLAWSHLPSFFFPLHSRVHNNLCLGQAGKGWARHSTGHCSFPGDLCLLASRQAGWRNRAGVGWLP